MIENINTTNHPRNNKIFAGMVLLVVGCALLLRQINDYFIPDWLFDWPMILIILGLYTGARSNFRKPTWFILFILGVGFLLNDAIPGFHLSNLIWPALIIALGIWMILKRNHKWEREDFNLKMKSQAEKWKWQNYVPSGAGNWQAPPVAESADEPNAEPKDYKTYNNMPPSGDDRLDTVSIFGGVKKKILSKDFKGGEIVNIFGGAELDFTLADINGRVVIDIVQIFGGTKIIVPSNWQVVSDLAAVFAAVDDKRIKTTASPDNLKILVLTGASIFAGVDVRSF
jgi:predicted membrane protein